MLTDHVKQKVAEIIEVRDDYEKAHGLEDQLYEDFVQYICDTGTTDQRSLARVVLSTKDIDFPRYTA